MKINELKQNAKIKLTGNHIRCASSSLLYFIIISLLTFFQAKLANSIQNSVILAVVQALFILINWILGYGIIANILNLVDIKTNSITDFINSSLKSCIKYTKIGLIFLLKILPSLILNILAIFYWAGTAIAKVNKVNFLCFYQNLIPVATLICIVAFLILIYDILKYILVGYIYYEHSDMTESEIVEKSKELMNRKKTQYILLLLSFLHWFLLAALLLMILNTFIKTKYLTPFMVLFYSMIRPYMIVAKYEFYKELEDTKTEKIEKNKQKEEA